MSETDIAEQLRDRTTLRYMGNCKCGKCQLVPRDLVVKAADGLDVMLQLRAFVGIMFGEGPHAIIPNTVRTPLGIPLKIGDLMDRADAVAKATRAVGVDEARQPEPSDGEHT